MYNIDDLNVRLLSELKEIAEGLGVKNFKKLHKKELIYKILDYQTATLLLGFLDATKRKCQKNRIKRHC